METGVVDEPPYPSSDIYPEVQQRKSFELPFVNRLMGECLHQTGERTFPRPRGFLPFGLALLEREDDASSVHHYFTFLLLADNLAGINLH